MSRRADWERRLHALVERAERLRFAYGSHDCCSFAAEVVRVQTGQDYFKPFRGKYSSAAGSLRALKANRHKSIADAFTSALGDPVAVLQAQRGDVVFDGTAVGVMWCGGALFVGEEGTREGLVLKPLSTLQKAWSVDNG